VTDRATARHRAPQRVSTPLSTLSTGITLVLGDRMEALSRGGAVIAVSSGLVASMALPASALTGQATDDGAITASIPLGSTPVSRAGSASDAALSAPLADAPLADAPLTAPATASLQFDTGSLSAATVRAGTTAHASAAHASTAQTSAAGALATRTQAATVSRSSTRSQLRQTRTAAAQTASAPAAAKTASVATAVPMAKAAPTTSGAQAAPAMGSAVVALASRYVGVWYRYGGSTPSGFDCSGYVQYVYSHLGFKLPRTADQQLHAIRRISRSQARPGDLVFFVYGGYASHVAIYAGDGMMYDAPHTGARVGKRKIYSATVVFGRVVN